jgi:hypothetical protein
VISCVTNYEIRVFQPTSHFERMSWPILALGFGQSDWQMLAAAFRKLAETAEVNGGNPNSTTVIPSKTGAAP